MSYIIFISYDRVRDNTSYDCDQAPELVLHNDRSRYYEDCDGYKN